MKILFFFVHPSKFHTFKPVINKLTAAGHHVDITIISKDVLPVLLEKSGLSYTNIFPAGRRSRSRNRLAIMFTTVWNAFLTVWRLWRYVKKSSSRYDLFVTDDCLSVVGALTRTSTIFFLDDDLHVVPEIAPLLRCATKIFAPAPTKLGRFDVKKIGFNGYKEACYLLPEYFTADSSIPAKYGLEPGKYVFIRLVALSATHDLGKHGISDDRLDALIAVVKQHGLRPVLSLERSIGSDYEQYRFPGAPDETIHILAHSALYFGDSQTMTSEAVLLGVPAIRCNDFVGRISVMEEKETKYDMTYGFLSKDFGAALQKTGELLHNLPEVREQWREKHRKMLAGLDDIPSKLFEIITNWE